jgi:hypothetical protein
MLMREKRALKRVKRKHKIRFKLIPETLGTTMTNAQHNISIAIL